MIEPSVPRELASRNRLGGSSDVARKAEGWRAVLGLVAEVLAISSIFAFALSCVANHLVFRAWGHDFLQLASPSDVIMSGTRILGVFFLPVLGGLGLALLFTVFWHNFDRVDAFVRRSTLYKNFSDKQKMIARIIVNSTGATLILLVIAVGFYSWFFSGTFEVIVESSLSFALVFVGINGIVFIIREFRLGKTDKWIDSIILIMAIFLLASGINLVADWFVRRVEKQAASGFHMQSLAVRVDTKDICPSRGTLLWSGSDSALVACNIKGRRYVVVIRNPENVLFIPHDVGDR